MTQPLDELLARIGGAPAPPRARRPRVPMPTGLAIELRNAMAAHRASTTHLSAVMAAAYRQGVPMAAIGETVGMTRQNVHRRIRLWEEGQL